MIVAVRNIAVAIATAFAIMPASLHAEPLAPSTAWQLDYAENECRLIREFGTADQAMWLRIVRGARLENYDIMFGGSTLPQSRRPINLTMTALPNGLSTTGKAIPYSAKVGDKNMTVYRWSDSDKTFMNTFSDKQIIGIKTDNKIDLQIEASGIKKALTALTTCHDDLLKTVFKLDLETLRSYKSLPEPDKNAAFWITTDDYPQPALSNGWTGKTSFKVTVGENGKPAECVTIISTGYPSLDKTACQSVMQRGSFTPAKDANGQPVAAPWISSADWQIPR